MSRSIWLMPGIHNAVVEKARKCATCGIVFLSYANNSRFCQPGCRPSYKIGNGHTKTCESCKSEFRSRKIDARFCQPTCAPSHRRWFNENQRYKHYGWTAEQYEDQLAKQGGLCAICRGEKIGLVIDHCHKTGRVRGLLCNRCNMVLGRFKDDLDFLKTAIKYLEQAKLASEARGPEIDDLAHQERFWRRLPTSGGLKA